MLDAGIPSILMNGVDWTHRVLNFKPPETGTRGNKEWQV